MDLASLFGIAVLVMLLLVWASGDHVRQKLGILLLFAWAGSNLAVGFWGFTHAPLVIPSLDAAVAIAMAIVGYTNKSRIALILFAIYVFVGAVHVGAFALRAEMTYNYYATLNAAFALQLIALGVSAARLVVYRWAVWGGERLRPYPARR